MPTRRTLAIGAAILAIAALLAWRTGVIGGGGAATDREPAATSGAAAAADDDPWTRDPRLRARRGSGEVDPNAPELGTATVTGVVKDQASQRPVGGAEVVFWSKAGELSTTTGEDGRYRLDVPFGGWRARASAGDDALAHSQTVHVNARTIAVDLELERLGHVHGVVTDSAGRPVAGAEVTNQGADKGAQEALDATVGRAVLTDGAGRYRLAVVAGEVRVVATAEGKLGHKALPAVAAGADVEADLTLAGLATIDGTVVDDQGKPVAGAVVTAFVTILDIDLNVRRQVATGADGRFIVIDLDPGLLTLDARTTDGAAAPGRQLALDHGDVHNLVLTLTAAGVLAGQVTYSDGHPAGGAEIKVKRMNIAETFATTTADRDGKWSVRGPVATQFDVTAKDEYGVARAEYAVVGTPVELVIQVPGGLRGVVHTSKGAPITDFTVVIDRVVRPGNARAVAGPPPQRFTASDGKFEWPHLETGLYDLTFRAPGAAAAHRQAVAVPDSAWADVDVALDAGATVTGVVHGNETTKGEPIANARIDARCAGTSTSTDAHGGFTIADLPPGPCAIAVTAAGYAAVELRAEPGTPLDVALARGGDDTSEVVGVGAILEPFKDGARVVRVISTRAGGLAVGDVVVAVEGTAAATLGFAGIVSRLRGDVGSTVHVTVHRGTDDLDLALPRLRFAVPGVNPGLARAAGRAPASRA
jgi:hypothetical protein